MKLINADLINIDKVFIQKGKGDEECIRKSDKGDSLVCPITCDKIDHLNKELMTKDEEIERLETNRHILRDLFDKGITESEGNVLK